MFHAVARWKRPGGDGQRRLRSAGRMALVTDRAAAYDAFHAQGGGSVEKTMSDAAYDAWRNLANATRQARSDAARDPNVTLG